jgi:hypothetical protein
MPIRWYLLLSSWIFILSVLYPFHKISTFPLNLLALPGIIQIFFNPFKKNLIKNIYILFIHLSPFLWIPYDFSSVSLIFCMAIIIVYLIFILSMETDPFSIYYKLFNENHTNTKEFLNQRFGIN